MNWRARGPGESRTNIAWSTSSKTIASSSSRPEIITERRRLVAVRPDLEALSHQNGDRSLRLLDLGLLGTLLDHVDRVLARAAVLVSLSGGGDDLAVGRLEPPAILLGLVLVALELQLGRRVLLDPIDGVLAVAAVLVPLSGGGDDLAVGRLEPPAIALLLIAVGLECQRSRRVVRRVAGGLGPRVRLARRRGPRTSSSGRAW